MNHKQLVTAIKSVGMVNDHNLQPWTNRTSSTLKYSLRNPWRHLKEIVRMLEVKPLPVEPQRKLQRYEKNYIPSDSKKNCISYKKLDHESALSDILFAFHFLYSDYHVEIKRTPTIKIGGRKDYFPDAIVDITKDGKTYTFIVELERTRSQQAIYKEKLLKNEELPSFESMGLSPYTKILYICAHEHFNVYWRPLEYCLPHVANLIRINNRLVKDVLDLSAKLPDHKYRFIPLHQFTELHKPIWTTPKGQKVSLI